MASRHANEPNTAGRRPAVVSTDGACSGNPGPGGWAWVSAGGRFGAGGLEHTTNNVMELTAVLEAIRATAHLDVPVMIRSDSRYAIDCLTRWLPTWVRNDWRTTEGGAAANRELLEEIVAAMAGRDVRFEWVEGHTRDRFNEAADRLAVAARDRAAGGNTTPVSGRLVT